jgi:short-subunit dehydrogenase
MAFSSAAVTVRHETVLITGASGGIGYEFAKLFAQDRYNLILVARRGAELARVADELRSRFNASVGSVVLDLGLDDAPQTLFEQLQQQRIEVDILVNNAGFGKRGDFATQTSLEDSLGQVRLNITALTTLTRLFLQLMLARGRGKIMNVASLAGFIPGPHMAVYYATKSYVISFSQALANEVKDKGVTVTCVCPGATYTDWQKRANAENTALFKLLAPMQPDVVARIGYRALMANRALVVTGFRNWIIAQSARFAPRRLVTAVSRKVLEIVES